MEFFVGQAFEGSYPPEAAVWCMVNNAHIEQINGKYTIVENIKPQIDISVLIEFVYQEKCKIAYGGITVIKQDEKYLFETKKDSINMASGKAISITDKPDDFEINWKTWKDDIPVILLLTKKEFIDIFNFSIEMIDLAFALEGKLNLQIQSFSEKQLADEQFLTKFKENVITEFSKINTTYLLDNRE